MEGTIQLTSQFELSSRVLKKLNQSKESRGTNEDPLNQAIVINEEEVEEDNPEMKAELDKNISLSEVEEDGNQEENGCGDMNGIDNMFGAFKEELRNEEESKSGKHCEKKQSLLEFLIDESNQRMKAPNSNTLSPPPN